MQKIEQVRCTFWIGLFKNLYQQGIFMYVPNGLFKICTNKVSLCLYQMVSFKWSSHKSKLKLLKISKLKFYKINLRVTNVKLRPKIISFTEFIKKTVTSASDIRFKKFKNLNNLTFDHDFNPIDEMRIAPILAERDDVDRRSSVMRWACFWPQIP